MTSRKQFVLLIPDGAADLMRVDGRSPLDLANIEMTDLLAREGICGRARTLCADLPRESLVAQLGMLGWDPYDYYPHGRASAELLAAADGDLDEGDLAFRANLCRFEHTVLASYSGGNIQTPEAEGLLETVRRELNGEFREFEIHHIRDYRNILVIRDCGLDPRMLSGPEPHNSHGAKLDLSRLLSGRDEPSQKLAADINCFLVRVAEVLEGEQANALVPWSPSTRLRLSPFGETVGFDGRVAIVACMDFLQGVAKAGGMDFFAVGNGRPDTDFAGKGAQVVRLLEDGYDLVVCHVNAPDEASHMGNLELKIETLEKVDRHVLKPIVEYFSDHPDDLGGVMVVPDHYTNCEGGAQAKRRIEVHSLDPVPFVLWNGLDRDRVMRFSEAAVLDGAFADPCLDRLDLLGLLVGNGARPAATAPRSRTVERPRTVERTRR